MYGSAAYAELAYAEIGEEAEQRIVAPLLTNTSVFYGPSLSQGITAPLVENTSQIYAPTVSSGDKLFAPLLESANQFYAPRINQTIAAAHIGSSNQFYPATISMAGVTQLIVVPTLVNVSVFYNAKLTKRGGPITAAHSFTGDITQANALKGVSTITQENLFSP